jgi:hypothetical protein
LHSKVRLRHALLPHFFAVVIDGLTHDANIAGVTITGIYYSRMSFLLVSSLLDLPTCKLIYLVSAMGICIIVFFRRV